MEDITAQVSSLLQLYYDGLSTCEREATQRHIQLANLEVETSRLEAQRDLLQAFFEVHLAEQELLYNKALSLYDTAIKFGNADISKLATRMMRLIRQKSYF